jgi:DNA-binding NarL/FixJ family response regulator
MTALTALITDHADPRSDDTAKTTVLLVDDHHLVREGLRTVLETQPDLDVVGEAGDGLEAIRLVERLRPNVVVLDLMLPGLSGLDVARQLARRAPESNVLILSMHAGESYVLQALRNGAKGYVLKESSAEELIAAIHHAAKGLRYLSAALNQRAIESYSHQADGVADPYEQLTPREREVLHLVAEGSTNREIGRRLFISVRTVEAHRANLMRKLALRSRSDLIRYAMHRGILPLD